MDHPDGSVTPSKLAAINTPLEGYVLAYDSQSKAFKWLTAPTLVVDVIKVRALAEEVTLNPHQEITLYELKDRSGTTNVIFGGDGYEGFYVRVYEDDELSDEFPANEKRLGVYAFSSSFRIALYNPSSSPIRGLKTGFTIRGLGVR